MTCAECLDGLTAAVDQPSAALLTHLRGCPRCRARFERLQRALRTIETDPVPLVPPLHAGIWAGIAARRTLEPRRPAAARRDLAFATAMAVVILATAAAAAWRLPTPVWPGGAAAVASWFAGIGGAVGEAGALLGEALRGWGPVARDALPSPNLAWLSLAAGGALAAELGSRRATAVALPATRRGV